MFHIDTGIGVQITRDFVQETARRFGWKLTTIRSKDDCGMDYDAIVRKHGFPGPYGHQFMYRQLKERAVELLVRQTKTHRMDKIVLATGIREDESLRRMGYKGAEINTKGAQVWTNPVYWWPRSQRDDYLDEHKIPRNPVSQTIGMRSSTWRSCLRTRITAGAGGLSTGTSRARWSCCLPRWAIRSRCRCISRALRSVWWSATRDR